MKKVILFDFFGVISSEVSPRWFKRFFDEEEAKKVKDRIMSKGDLGERSEDEVISDAARVCGAECNEVRREWYSLATLDKETVKYIELLHKSHPVYLLSNAISTFLRTIIYKNNIENLFDKIYISSEMKLAKPDKKFFLHVLDDINAMPSECIMIDDNPENIAAAEAVGIHGIVYRGIDDLKDKLDEIL